MEKLVSSKPNSHLTLSDLVISGDVRERLVRMLAASTILDARVWLDGVHVSLNSLKSNSDGHELYFKIEGKVDSKEKPS